MASSSTSRDPSGAADAWAALPPGGRASLQQALAALRAGGRAVGSALVGPDGAVVAAGRDRTHGAPGGDDPLQRTALAHAGLNALARVHTSRDLSRDVLWSTQQPCPVCDAAAVLTGVRAVRWLSPAPWVTEAGTAPGRPADGVQRTGPGQGAAAVRWLVLARALLVASVAADPDLPRGGAGPDSPTVLACRRDDPAVFGLVEVLLARREAGSGARAGAGAGVGAQAEAGGGDSPWGGALPPSAEALAALLWDDVDAAASARTGCVVPGRG